MIYYTPIRASFAIIKPRKAANALWGFFVSGARSLNAGRASSVVPDLRKGRHLEAGTLAFFPAGVCE